MRKKTSLLILLIFTSCNHKELKVKSEALEVLDLSGFLKESKKTDQLKIKVANFFELEFSEESLIGKVDRALFFKDKLAVLDARISSSVTFFNDSGKYLSKIYREGNGPGYYGFLNDMDIDSLGQIHLLDLKVGKILVFDSTNQPVRTEKFGFKTEKFAMVGEQEYLFDQGFRRNQALVESGTIEDDCRIFHLNFKKNELKGYFKYTNAVEDAEGFTLPTSNQLYKSGNIVHYVKPFEYGIFSFDNNKKQINFDYELDFGKYRMPSDYAEKYIKENGGNDIVLGLMRSSFAHSINAVFETNDCLIFSFKHGMKPFAGVYFKNQQKLRVIDILGFGLENWSFLFFADGTHGNNFFSIMSADELFEIKKRISDNDYSDTLKELMDVYSPDMNPVLIEWSVSL